MSNPSGDALMARIKELEDLCFEAYQVIGTLLSDTDQFNTEHGCKILDNLSEGRIRHTDVLSWRSVEKVLNGN